MAQLKVSADLCTGCGSCCGVCPGEALSVRGGLAEADWQRCTLCGLCVSSCPFGALSMEEEAEAGGTPPAGDVWVVAQRQAGRILPVAFELLGQGRRLADARQSRLVALLLGSASEQETEALIQGGADRVFLWGDRRFDQGLEEPFADAIGTLAQTHRPEILLLGATGFGRSLAPRIAARLQTGLTADCTGLEICPENGWLLQTRPAFGGNLMAEIATKSRRPQMATVRPGVFPAPVPVPGRRGVVEPVESPAGAERVKLRSARVVEAGRSIADARVIVTAGLGIGSPKNLALVEELAALLGGAVGVTRALVDVGWAEYSRQIGQTGLSVAPQLLICCGVSGAIQHLAGIGGAQNIVAINTDPEAPIFSVANYKLTGDCVEILKKLLTLLRQGRARAAFPNMVHS